MMNRATLTERGYLLVADISGFIPFVTESETEHANEITRELLEFIIARLSPTFTLGQIDGDAIFAYAPQDRITRGETLFELLESIYRAYKNQLLQVNRRRSCGCNACQNASKLDLKFAVHFGEYIPNEFENQFNLIGLAPYFILKREWKEPVKKITDWQGYTLFTQECLTQLGFQPDELKMIEIPAGPVRTFGLDLESRYKSAMENRKINISEEEAQYSFSLDFPLPLTRLWDWVNDPEKRTRWFFLKWTSRERIKGRTSPGAVNHCNHGIGDTLETILDWKPFEYYTSEYQLRPFNIRIQQTTQFMPLPNGSTRINLNIKPASDSAGLLTKFVCNVFARYEKYVLNRLEIFLMNNSTNR